MNETDGHEPAPDPQSDNPLQPDLKLELPDDLPPVEPPSAGMIVQLFLVPALIVAVIIGVYALFGRLASQELDWRQLVVDVGSENSHVRGRGALGLAQMLDVDAARGDKGQHLAARPEIATALTKLYSKMIPLQNLNQQETNEVEFLSKALGRLESVDIVAPVLLQGIQPERNHDIRKHSMTGLAMLAGTALSAGHPLADPAFTAQMITISHEPEPLFRHQAAYVLGLVDSPDARTRLTMLLDDADEMTRLNAAIAFTRQNRLDGLPVLESIFAEAEGWKLDPAGVKTFPEEEQYFERMLMLTNSLKGVRQLIPQLSETQRNAVAGQLEKIVAGTHDAVLRTEALETIHLLKASGT
ncbi:HEAT repeat domain-containing protein [Planctomicrobium sp. SH664]|uniref:HEAT repeat domain-containing protein n=1 Tax=Planctomicrobium sp. SH664 TaxID=3448125 RepID=UPI003F5B23FB